MNRTAFSESALSFSSRAAARTFLCGVAMLGASRVAAALPGDLATKFRVNDDDPMKSIPSLEQRNADPLEFGYYLQDMVARAERAVTDKDWQRAIKYYEPLARAVPDRAIAFSRLCLSYAELGRVDSAVNACSNAIHLEGALVIDHLRFIRLSLRKAELSPSELVEIDTSIAHVRAHAESHPVKPRSRAPVSSRATGEGLVKNFVQELKDAPADDAPIEGSDSTASKVNLRVEIEVLACKVAVSLRDPERVERCLATVRGLNLHPSVLLPIQWARALLKKDAAQATALFEQARAAGLPEAALTAMAEEQRKELGRAPSGGFLRRWGYSVLGGLLVLVLVAWSVLQLSSGAKRSKAEAASV